MKKIEIAEMLINSKYWDGLITNAQELATNYSKEELQDLLDELYEIECEATWY